MDTEVPGKRTCPACGSGEYAFSGRKTVAKPGEAEQVETKYRCKKCGHLWKVRVAK